MRRAMPWRLAVLAGTFGALACAHDDEAKQRTTPQPLRVGKGTITLVVTMEIKPEREAEFLAEARTFIEKVHRGEPGALLYTLSRHPTSPHTFVWTEVYRDAAALQAHASTPYMVDIRPRVKEWLARPPDGLRLEQLLPE